MYETDAKPGGEVIVQALRKHGFILPEPVPVAGNTCDNNAITTTDLLIMQKSFSDLEYAAKKLARCMQLLDVIHGGY